MTRAIFKSLLIIVLGFLHQLTALRTTTTKPVDLLYLDRAKCTVTVQGFPITADDEYDFISRPTCSPKDARTANELVCLPEFGSCGTGRYLFPQSPKKGQKRITTTVKPSCQQPVPTNLGKLCFVPCPIPPPDYNDENDTLSEDYSDVEETDDLEEDALNNNGKRRDASDMTTKRNKKVPVIISIDVGNKAASERVAEAQSTSTSTSTLLPNQQFRRRTSPSGGSADCLYSFGSWTVCNFSSRQFRIGRLVAAASTLIGCPDYEIDARICNTTATSMISDDRSMVAADNSEQEDELNGCEYGGGSWSVCSRQAAQQFLVQRLRSGRRNFCRPFRRLVRTCSTNENSY